MKLRITILIGVFIFSANVFANDEVVPFWKLGMLQTPKTEFGAPETECYSDKEGEDCSTFRKCVHKYFHAIRNTDIYFALEKDTQVDYLVEGQPFDKRFCHGEPGSQVARIYRKTDRGYIEVGGITADGCSLSADEIYEFKRGEFLKTTCSYTGTGGMVEDGLYYITESQVSRVRVDKGSIKIPNPPMKLGGERFQIKDDKISLSYSAHPRHCQCVAEYSVDLALTRGEDGSLSLTFVDGSYRPHFTSLSNARNQKGLKYYQQGELDAAIREFKKAQELDVGNYEPISNLGLAYLKIGDLDNSIRFSKGVFDHGVGKLKANAAYNLGKAYEKLGNWQQSLKFYRAANSAAPSSARKSAVERVQALMDTQLP